MAKGIRVARAEPIMRMARTVARTVRNFLFIAVSFLVRARCPEAMRTGLLILYHILSSFASGFCDFFQLLSQIVSLACVFAKRREGIMTESRSFPLTSPEKHDIIYL
jgi:hypothetical protein